MNKQPCYLNDCTVQEVSAASLNLYELSSFIVFENYKHHGVNFSVENLESEISRLHKEECLYSEWSKYCIARDSSEQITGAIRIMKWDGKVKLPMQKIFGINPVEEIKLTGNGSIWHIGRFAVRDCKKISGVMLFKLLSIHALKAVYENENDIAIAECDSKLVRVLSALGMQFQTLGMPVSYLGSDTVPVFLTQSGVANFFKRHQVLVSREPA